MRCSSYWLHEEGMRQPAYAPWSSPSKLSAWCRHKSVHYEGSHKNGCTFAVYAKTLPDGSVSVTSHGSHQPTCGKHQHARRLSPLVKQYIFDLLDLGVAADRIYSFFQDPAQVPKRECPPAWIGTCLPASLPAGDVLCLPYSNGAQPWHYLLPVSVSTWLQVFRRLRVCQMPLGPLRLPTRHVGCPLWSRCGACRKFAAERLDWTLMISRQLPS